MPAPYIGFSNETLSTLPDMRDGDEITCPLCKKTHSVYRVGPMFFYGCGDGTYLAGINGKCTIGVPVDVRGEL